MALDEYLDPEPICVKGIEPETAEDRAYDIGEMTRGIYFCYRANRYLMPVLVGVAGLNFSSRDIRGFALGLVGCGLAYFVERFAIRGGQKHVMEFLAENCPGREENGRKVC